MSDGDRTFGARPNRFENTSSNEWKRVCRVGVGCRLFLLFASSTTESPPMSLHVTLRAVESDDLSVFFERQLDPEATHMAAFPSRERDAFMAHWARVLANPDCATRTILCDGRVAGNIGAWTDADLRERLVGYWIGRDFWGRGVATAALSQFLCDEIRRPLVARVATHNTASLRVLQKCGFTLTGEDRFEGAGGEVHEELILTLASTRPS